MSLKDWITTRKKPDVKDRVRENDDQRRHVQNPTDPAFEAIRQKPAETLQNTHDGGRSMPVREPEGKK